MIACLSTASQLTPEGNCLLVGTNNSSTATDYQRKNLYIRYTENEGEYDSNYLSILSTEDYIFNPDSTNGTGSLIEDFNKIASGIYLNDVSYPWVDTEDGVQNLRLMEWQLSADAQEVLISNNYLTYDPDNEFNEIWEDITVASLILANQDSEI